MVNRRNVVCDVSKNVDACKKFLLMELTARIVVCYLQVLGIDDINDQPADEKLGADILRNSKAVKRKYLHDLSSKVVDSYLVQKDHMEMRLQKQRYVDWLKSTNDKTPDGKYKCRQDGCVSTFLYDGKKRMEHEKSHGLHLDSPKATNVFSDDSIFCYQLSFMDYAMVVYNFYDAVSEGDGMRIIRCWKFMLPHLKHDGQRSRKYALEGMYLITQIEAMLSPAEAHSIIWNRFHKRKESFGGNIPLDLMLEHYNNVMKSVIRLLGPNNTNHRAVDRYAKALTINKQLLDNFDLSCKTIVRSGKHTIASAEKDLHKIIKELVKTNALQHTKNRQYKSLNCTQTSLIEDLDVHNMYTWIESHKMNLSMKRGKR